MLSTRIKYALPGLVSLLGLIGIFTPERIFLCFFGFAAHFQYLFVPSDEMMEENMSRSAAWGFYCGMVFTALGTLVSLTAGGNAPAAALLDGILAGWVASVLGYSAVSAWRGFRERWGMEHDS